MSPQLYHEATTQQTSQFKFILSTSQIDDTTEPGFSVFNMWALKIYFLFYILHNVVCNGETQGTIVKNQPKPVEMDDRACPSGSECVPQIQCPAHVLDNENPIYCHIRSERLRICCSTGQNHTDTLSEKARSTIQTKIVHIPDDLLHNSARKAEENSEQLLWKLRVLNHDKNVKLPKGTPSFTHFRNSKFQSAREMKRIQELSDMAMKMVNTAQEIKQKARFGNEVYERGWIQHAPLNHFKNIQCHPAAYCEFPYSKYTTLDGTCNNLKNTVWGSARTPFNRLLPPLYDDGVVTPRRSHSGKILPSTRAISDLFFYDEDHPDYYRTQMFMAFGQFISHEITHGIPSKLPDGSPINCCPKDNEKHFPEELRHPACYPIEVDRRDRFFGYYNVSCINFVRSLLAPKDDCSLGYADQMNKVTSFLDGSVIYGTDPELLSDLREHSSGRLRMFHDFGRDLLPLSKNPSECLTMEKGNACFSSGDTRTNQMVSLTVIHILFAREHNRICGELEKFNPHWEDERLFLEARKILVAEFQHIVYSQWLPEAVGYEAMHEFDLDVHYPGHSNTYDPYVNPSITNEFATAAFRFGHSIVGGKLRINGKYRLDEIIDIPEVMFSPARLRMRRFFDEILSALTLDTIQRADAHVSETLTNYMFRGGNPFGLDLVAINIQRGRDHGLRSYNDYRQLVGLPRHYYFEDFGHKAGEILKYLYESVDDVDLYVGALLEPPIKGAVVGLTFRDMIADQFFRLKKGDRYFYNLGPAINPGAFTSAQLAEIQKSSLSRIICDNSDHYLLMKQAMNPFRKPGAYGNRILYCNAPYGIPRMDLSHWKENDYH